MDVGQNVHRRCGAKRLWMYMGQNVYGRVAYGAKCLVWGESPTGKNVHTWFETSMGQTLWGEKS